MRLLKDFKDSAKEFTKLRSVVTIAMLLAVHTVLALYLSVRVSDSLKISTGFVAVAICTVAYGPVVGFVFGALGDVIQWALNPTGPLALGLTFNAALTGLAYGIAFYKRLPKNPGAASEDKSAKQVSRVYSWSYGISSAAFLIVGFGSLFR